MIADLKAFLDEKYLQYNNPKFIESDPIQVPHLFQKKEDIEIAGLLAATIAWGQRKTIIANSLKMMELLDQAPHDFVMNHHPKDLKRFSGFVHRTFNENDLTWFIGALQNIYINHQSLEKVFKPLGDEQNLKNGIDRFRLAMLETPHETRSQKHVSSPAKGSASKRLIMYLRWMIRQDNAGVDFGIWKDISPALLSCPLDVHSGNVARKLGLLNRKQNDWRSVEELDSQLRKLDPTDPAKYDYSLFGLGVFEGF
jgi:uncharacterized protein (TIGR02757 family)